MKKNNILALKLIRIAKKLVSEIDQKQIQKTLKKQKIKEYKPFKKIHDNEWMMYPENRNADVPDVYVKLNEDNQLLSGYNYINSDKDNYQGTPQETISGLLIEFAEIKKQVEKAIVEAKNQALDKEKEQKKENEDEDEQEEYDSDEEDLAAEKDKAVDDFLNGGGDEGGDQGGDEGGGQEDSGGDEGGDDSQSAQ